ncbi:MULTISPECIES: LysR family transcriptional regulator [unclassified Sphingomonas]|uniref:LysR family transcriptional regulator n=1 Tax=unclassified Sphingomonas TaxID=196159 RepID=UPI001042E522|nr:MULTISPECIES: LysR family transcriptional regulator [unclassified Sphingomonas]MBB3349507.1 DNA-binding transcriptional LysR family regulator [Sphingomonas sp. BK069]TCP32439.1 LysR family transcriptional regulator [Sphingomonas sp. BK235]
MLDWDDLKTFLAIARHGTLSAAARALKVSQTTMGRRLDHLHGRAGVVLLERTPTGYRLTPAGAAILGDVEHMDGAALAAERTLTGGDQRLAGLVRVTTVDALAAHVLTPGLAALNADHPGIVVELLTDNRSLSLARREADVAVRLGRFEAHETIVRKAGEMAFGVFASADYLRRYGSPDWSAGAPGHRIVRVQDDLLATPDGRWFAERTGKAEPALLANSRAVQLSGVAAGLGLGHLPCYLAETCPDLMRIEAGEAVRREIWMGVHRDTRHAPRIVAVQQAVVAALEAKRDALLGTTSSHT